MKRTIFVGWDPREAKAYAVALHSLSRRLGEPIPVHGLALSDMMGRGLYARPMEHRGGRLHDAISDAPMSTEHACARFLVKELAQTGWALFMDGDVLVRSDVSKLFEILNPDKAVYCVHHRHEPAPGLKMDGQVQTAYARKNWSSVMAINCDHPANERLTVDLINAVPGRDLHRFCWLDEGHIGELSPEWNYLVGVTEARVEPKIVHFTLGLPNMAGYEGQPYADEWRAELMRQAA